MVRTLSWLLGLSFLLTTGCDPKTSPAPTASAVATPQPPRPPPPDVSLTSVEYIDMGMPSPSRPWMGVDMERAAAVIAKIGPGGALPRFESANSSGLFARITSPENIEVISANPSSPLATRVTDTLALTNAINTILKVYLNAAAEGRVGPRELIELIGFQVRVTCSMAVLLEKLLPTISKDDPSYSTRMNGVKQARSGMANVVAGTLTSLGERSFYTSADCKALMPHLTASVPTILKSLDDDSRREMIKRIEELSRDELQVDIRPELIDLCNKVKARE